MKAIDLFCCDGGATRRLRLAGFHVMQILRTRSAA